jgi:Fe2+ transport system protein FeoA
MSRTDARSGDTVLVERVDLSSAAAIRLGELGLGPGEELRALRNQRPRMMDPGACPRLLQRFRRQARRLTLRPGLAG